MPCWTICCEKTREKNDYMTSAAVEEALEQDEKAVGFQQTPALPPRNKEKSKKKRKRTKSEILKRKSAFSISMSPTEKVCNIANPATEVIVKAPPPIATNYFKSTLHSRSNIALNSREKSSNTHQVKIQSPTPVSILVPLATLPGDMCTYKQPEIVQRLPALTSGVPREKLYNSRLSLVSKSTHLYRTMPLLSAAKSTKTPLASSIPLYAKSTKTPLASSIPLYAKSTKTPLTPSIPLYANSQAPHQLTAAALLH